MRFDVLHDVFTPAIARSFLSQDARQMQSRKDLFEMTSTFLVTVAAIAMVIMYADANLTPADSRSSRPVSGWQEENRLGVWLGPKQAPMVVTEFMDLTCPFCALLNPVIDSLMDRHPEDVAVVFQHLPLTGREHSIPAAIAAECADRQGLFPEMVALLFSQQDSIGLKPWVAFAGEIGIPNQGEFERCISLPPDSLPRIAAGKDLAARVGITGTPTVWVNGRRFGGRDLAAFERRASELGLGG